METNSEIEMHQREFSVNQLVSPLLLWGETGNDDHSWTSTEERTSIQSVLSQLFESKLKRLSENGSVPSIDYAENDESCHPFYPAGNTLVPTGVYSVARLHLSSLGNRHYAAQNTFRQICSHREDTKNLYDDTIYPIKEKGQSLHRLWIIVGIGQIAEVVPSITSSSVGKEITGTAPIHPKPTIIETNDRQQLLDQFECNESSGLSPSLKYVKHCVLSPNCIAVSWGFDDGIIILYRKIQISKENKRLQWDAVAMIEPQHDIVNALNERISGDDTNSKQDLTIWKRLFGKDHLRQDYMFAFESGLMRVSGMVLMQSDLTQNESSDIVNGTTHGITMLGISRLGGYLEIFIVPSSICDGAILQPKNNLGFTRRNAKHYASGLPSLNDIRGCDKVGLSSIPHHFDITSLAVHNTHIDRDLVWDDAKYPDGPPVEFILAATGHSTVDLRAGQAHVDVNKFNECLSLWGIALIQNMDAQDVDELSSSIHAGFLQKIYLPSKDRPEIKTFVRDLSSVHSPLCTISSPCPISSLEFVSDIYKETGNEIMNEAKESMVLIAMSDFNGGLFIADCSSIISAVTRPRFDFEASNHNIKLIFDHRLSSRENDSTISSIPIIDHAWWKSTHGLRLICIDFNDTVHIHNLIIEKTGPKLRPHRSTSLSLSGQHDYVPTFWKNSSTKTCVPFLLESTSIPKAHLCCVAEYGSMNSIQSLTNQNRYSEVRDIATRPGLDIPDSSSTNNCYKYLWERDYSVDNFIQISDDNYVIKTALKIEQISKEVKSITLSDVREIMSEALRRMKRQITIEDINKDGKRNDILALESILLRLGTYLIIGNFRERKCHSAKRFFEKVMQNGAISTLASNVASRGDLESLNIIFIRHWNEIGANVKRMEIIGFLPWNRKVQSYAKFLPSWKESNATQFIEEAENMSRDLFLDQYDRHIVLNVPKNVYRRENKIKILQWYLYRAKTIECKTGLLEDVEEICDIAISSCPLISSSRENIIMTATFNEILSLRTSARVLNKIIIRNHRIRQKCDSTKISLARFERMTAEEIVGLVTKCNKDVDKIMRLKEFFDDLNNEKLILHDNENSWVLSKELFNRDRLDSAIISHCLLRIRSSIQNDSRNSDLNASALNQALALCLDFATASKTSTGRELRLIQDEKALMQLFLEITRAVWCFMTRFSVRNKVWGFYTCLPLRVDSIESQDAEWQSLAEKVDHYHRSFTCLEIMLSWSTKSTSEDNIVQYLISMHNWFIQCEHDSHYSELGAAILLFVCKRFHEQVLVCAKEHRLQFFLQYIADTRDLSEYCFRSTTTSTDDFFQRGTLYHNIVDEDSIWGAECQRQLFPYFFRKEFDSMQLCKDTHILVGTLDLGDPFIPTFSELGAFQSIDLVLSIIEKNPNSVMSGCSKWNNPGYASNTIRVVHDLLFSEYHTMLNGSTSLPLPLPGDSIVDIASKLGLGDAKSQFLIRNYIVRHAVRHNYFDSAAVICLFLIHTVVHATDIGNNIDISDQRVLLRSIVSVITCELYMDHGMKSALCQLCLKWCEIDNIIESSIFNCHRELEDVKFRSESRGSDNGQNSDRQLFISGRTLLMESTRIGNVQMTDTPDLLLRHFYEICLGHLDPLPVLDTITPQFILENILRWSILEAATINDSTTLQLRRIFRKEMIYLVVSSYIFANESNWISSSPSAAIQLLEDETLKSYERLNRSEVAPFVETDEDIVRRLNERGYSINGSKRAAAMTKNENFSAGLVWAVSHSSDLNFNDPLIFLQKSSESDKLSINSAIDTCTLAIFKASLYSAQIMIEKLNTLDQKKYDVKPPFLNKITKADIDCHAEGKDYKLCDTTESTNGSQKNDNGVDKSSSNDNISVSIGPSLRERGRKLLSEAKLKMNSPKNNGLKTLQQDEKRYSLLSGKKNHDNNQYLDNKGIKSTREETKDQLLINLGTDERRRLAEEGRRILRKRMQQNNLGTKERQTLAEEGRRIFEKKSWGVQGENKM